MIVFTKIRYKNFLASGNVWTEISLNTHKNTLIMGSNGAGKSTLLDALTFSLFGKPFRKVNKGNIVNSINNKQCVVEIEFTIGNKDYKVVRGIKPNIFEIYCNDVLVNQDASSRDYQDYLESSILKMTYKTFTQVVILGSSSFTPFMDLSAADRRAVIENLLDIQIFSIMSAIVKNKLQLNKDSLERNRITLTSKEENKSYIEKTLQVLRANSKQKLTELCDTMNELLTKRDSLTVDIKSTQEKIDGLLDNVTSDNTLRKKHTTLISLRSKMENNRDRYIKDTDFFAANGDCPTCRQKIDPEFAKVMVESNYAKMNEINDGITKINKQIDECLNSIDEVDAILKKINELRIELSSNQAAYKSLVNQLLSINTQIEEFSSSDKTTQDSERQLTTVKSEITELQKEKESLLDERKYIDVSSTLLKDGGIKSTIVKKYLPVINKNINTYLSKLGMFVSFNLDENFEETIKSRHRDEYVYNNFSEGEKLRIDLAILLTWRLVAKQKNSVSCNLLIFDEILDRAMDSDGIDEFIQIMWNLGYDGSNVFVISHRDTMTEKFQRTLEFQKIKNFSVLK